MPSFAKCRACRHTFTPTYTEDVHGSALYLDARTQSTPLAPLTAPLPTTQPPAAEPIAPIAPIAAPPAPPVFRFEAPAAASFPGSAAAAVAEPETQAPPEARVEPRFVAPPAPQGASFSAPAPPKIVNRESAEAALEQERLLAFNQGRLRPFEIVLAVGLVAAVFAGIGWWWYQSYESKYDPTAAADVADDTPVATPSHILPEDVLTPKPRPPELAGTWELRTDDGRSGMLIFGADGRLAAKSSSSDSPLPDYSGHWYLLEHTGNRYVLEFGRERRGIDGYKVTLQLTAPDAFTLIETIKSGARLEEKHRFVRTGPAVTAKAQRP